MLIIANQNIEGLIKYWRRRKSEPVLLMDSFDKAMVCATIVVLKVVANENYRAEGSAEHQETKRREAAVNR